MKYIFATVAMTITVACTSSQQSASVGQAVPIDVTSVYSFCPHESGKPIPVPLDVLVKNLPDFEGKTVETEGYLHSEFEHRAIYSKPSHRPGIQEFSNGLWVLAAAEIPSGKLLRLTGTVTTKSKGHLGQWPGAFCVTRKVAVVAA